MDKKIYDSIDIEFSKKVMEDLIGFGSCSMGFHLAGSSSELAAADYLYETYKKIGLVNVKKDEVILDSFEFKGARIRYLDSTGNQHEIDMASYHTTYQAENEEIEIVYLGKGTDKDYEGIDVSGRVVLIDIDQLNEWWINWPAYQAKVKGAKAVIAANIDGFCTYSDDTVGVQDYCGPSDAPAFSISVKQADELKDAIGGFGRSIKAVLDSDALVSHNMPAYNIIGEIPGSCSGYIYIIAHYDAYFRAYGDNTSGVGCMLGIANALIKSGYKPRKTIRIIAHCAEEWGIDNSRHDWARGAQLEAEKHPDWGDDGFVALNLDCGLISGLAKGIVNRTQYELSDALCRIGNAVEGNTIGKVRVESPSWTWSENYVYTKLGIPTIDPGLDGDDDTGYYHSSSDTKQANSYSDETFLACHKIYCSYLTAFDEMDVMPFDFTKTFSTLSKSVDAAHIGKSEELLAACKRASDAAEHLKEKSEKKMTCDEASGFNRRMGKIFKAISNRLYSIDWDENNDFVHVYKQNNVMALAKAIKYLDSGEAEKALEDEIAGIDLNWYAFSFDKKTYDFFVDQVIGKDARNSWGTGINDNVDLWKVIRSLKEKTSKGITDFKDEADVLEKEMINQQNMLSKIVDREIKDIDEITEMIKQA